MCGPSRTVCSQPVPFAHQLPLNVPPPPRGGACGRSWRRLQRAQRTGRWPPAACTHCGAWRAGSLKSLEQHAHGFSQLSDVQ
eukprot:5986600-Alexandrium_andersonii.AAC.1